MRDMGQSTYMTVANGISLGRLLLFFVSLWMLAIGRVEVAIVLFISAWAMDAIDGYVARLLGQETVFGYYFDKVVDRFVLIVGTLMFIRFDILPVYALFVFVKDAGLIPSLYFHFTRNNSTLGVGRIGKIATVLQGCCLVWLFLAFPYGHIAVSAVAVFGAFVAVRHIWMMQKGFV